MAKVAKIAAAVVGVVALTIATMGAGLYLAGFAATASLAVGGLSIGLGTIASIGLIGVQIGFSSKPKGINAAEQLASNLSITAGPSLGRTVVFGRTGIAGQVLFRKNISNAGTAEDPDEVIIILSLAGYPVTSLEKFWLNGTLVYNGETTTGPGAITTGTFANKLWVYFRTGAETDAAFSALDSLAPEWAAKTRKLRGIAAAAIRLKVTEDLDGRLEPLFQIKGSKLYDPRLDSSVEGGSGSHDWDDPTTWEWSENPKLAELLYLRGGEVNDVRIFGMGKPKTAVDLENFASEANICEESIDVSGGGTISRYTCNGILIPTGDHRTNLTQLLSASAGTMDSSDGVYRTFSGAWRTPVMTLTEEDIDGAPAEIVLDIDPTTEINVIKGNFADPTDKWQVKEYPERRDQDSIDKIGERSIQHDLPFTTDHRIAQRISKVELLRANAQKTMSANYWLNTLQLQPGDIVNQTYARYGFSSDTMRVNFWSITAVEDSQGRQKLVVNMQLKTELEAWFDWDPDTEEVALESGAVAFLPDSIQRIPWTFITGDDRPEDGSTRGAPPGTPVGNNPESIDTDRWSRDGLQAVRMDNPLFDYGDYGWTGDGTIVTNDFFGAHSKPNYLRFNDADQVMRNNVVFSVQAGQRVQLGAYVRNLEMTAGSVYFGIEFLDDFGDLVEIKSYEVQAP